MGIFGALSDQALGLDKELAPIMARPTFPAKKPKGDSAMREWGLGRRLLGGLLDGILSTTGGQPVNLPLMLAQRQRALGLEDEQRKRRQDLEDAVALAQAKAQFREPTALQQNFSWFQGLTPPQQKEFGRYQDMTRPLIPLDVQSTVGGPTTRTFLTQSEASGAGDDDATPTIEEGYQYTPGPGGRANQANWKPAGGVR